MLKLQEARQNIPLLEPWSPPKNGIDRPLDKTSARKKLPPVRFQIKHLRKDISVNLLNVMYHVNFMNPPPSLNAAQLRLMRACLDARETLF